MINRDIVLIIEINIFHGHRNVGYIHPTTSYNINIYAKKNNVKASMFSLNISKAIFYMY